MSLSDLEQTALAYFIAVPANDISIAGRFFPRADLELIIEDKIAIATRKFGPKARGTAKPVSKAFVATMIEKGGWSSKPNDFGGAMHQFQLDAFRAALKELKARNPIVQEAQGKGADFWPARFAALTS